MKDLKKNALKIVKKIDHSTSYNQENLNTSNSIS